MIYDEGRQTIAGAPLVKNQEELYIGDAVEALEKKFDVMVCIENDTHVLQHHLVALDVQVFGFLGTLDI